MGRSLLCGEYSFLNSASSREGPRIFARKTRILDFVRWLLIFVRVVALSLRIFTNTGFPLGLLLRTAPEQCFWCGVACIQLCQYSPDVLIVDLRIPKKDGLQVVDELMSGRPPKPRVIVITTYEDEEDIRRAVKAGAKGYLVKVADCEQIEAAIRTVAAGGSLFPTQISLKLVEAVARPELSKRELDVLHFIATGKSNKEIGVALYISELTVKGRQRAFRGRRDSR